ncbi:hypothetical protein H0H92_004923 [Tricholoma furcatifolium]|nr:hypothetical protein H0H92_004923 [Tricholoma furcatifolium]
MTSTTDEHADIDTASNEVIRINIPPRFYLVPGAAFIVGTTIGLSRGSREASLRFLAENAHRPPRTVQGWYFYNKTKNYKVIFGGLKGAGKEAGKLTTVAFGWVGIEELLERVGWGQVSEIGAGVGTAGVLSAVYRLPWKTTGRALVTGLVIGTSLKIMRLGRKGLEEKARGIGSD